jgi:hypothetical protein
MEVVKEEKEFKLKNSSIKNVLSYYVKLVNADFDAGSMDVALSIVEDSFKLEDAFKSYQKLEKNILEKYQKLQQEGKEVSQKDIEIINNKLQALAEEVTVIKGPLTKIPKEIQQLIKIKPIELKSLKEIEVI